MDIGNHQHRVVTVDIGNHHPRMAAGDIGNHQRRVATVDIGNHQPQMAAGDIGNHQSRMATVDIGNHQIRVAAGVYRDKYFSSTLRKVLEAEKQVPIHNSGVYTEKMAFQILFFTISGVQGGNFSVYTPFHH